MAWIKSYQEIERHPKTIVLMKEMNWNLDMTISKLHRLWWWCADYAYDGDISKHDPDTISTAIGCQDMKGEYLIAALVKAGFVDEQPNLRLHDWWAHFGDFLKARFSRTPDKWKLVESSYTSGCHQVATRNPLNKGNKEINREKETTMSAAADCDGNSPVNWDNCTSDLQRVVAHYVKISTPALYANCSKSQATGIFKEQGKAVGPLLRQCGNAETACRVIDKAAKYYQSKGLDWSLYAVSRSCTDYLEQVVKENTYGAQR
jgi:glutamine synthetase adenylyltransferase